MSILRLALPSFGTVSVSVRAEPPDKVRMTADFLGIHRETTITADHADEFARALASAVKSVRRA